MSNNPSTIARSAMGTLSFAKSILADPNADEETLALQIKRVVAVVSSSSTVEEIASNPQNRPHALEAVEKALKVAHERQLRIEGYSYLKDALRDFKRAPTKEVQFDVKKNQVSSPAFLSGTVPSHLHFFKNKDPKRNEAGSKSTPSGPKADRDRGRSTRSKKFVREDTPHPAHDSVDGDAEMEDATSAGRKSPDIIITDSRPAPSAATSTLTTPSCKVPKATSSSQLKTEESTPASTTVSKDAPNEVPVKSEPTLPLPSLVKRARLAPVPDIHLKGTLVDSPQFRELYQQVEDEVALVHFTPLTAHSSASLLALRNLHAINAQNALFTAQRGLREYRDCMADKEEVDSVLVDRKLKVVEAPAGDVPAVLESDTTF
ncbi:hypothetical protein V5O48_017768, partial [Marasmius crinis-equi]